MMSHRQQQQQQHHKQLFQPPTLFSISRGEVTRIEPYGCFVKLIPNITNISYSSSPISGLVHISQLYTSKVSNVSDIVSLNDEVWVKVIDVQVENTTDDVTGKTRSRHKVKLSMKYVNQETGNDLDPENELFEEDRLRITNRSGGSGRDSNYGNDHGGANSLLGRALVSNIGMSTAIDPGNLILRGTTSRGMNKSTAGADAGNSSFNGYALVGDDEGEPLPPPITTTTTLGGKDDPSFSSSSLRANPIMTMGRGRGLTLPAWMTQSDTTEDKLGTASGSVERLKDRTDRKNDDHVEKRHRRRDKRHRTGSNSKERHHKHASSRADSRGTHNRHKERDEKVHKRRGRRRGRSRSTSPSPSFLSKETRRLSLSSSSSESYYHNSCSRSMDRRSRHHHKKKKSHKRDQHSNHRRSSSSRRSNRQDRKECTRRSWSQSCNRSSSPQLLFTNAEEAKAIVEQFEQRR